MKKVHYIFLLCFLTLPFLYSFLTPEEKPTIEWMTFEEAVAQHKQDSVKKKMMIDIYTNWCGWCKKMDKGTFTDPDIVQYVNENFYPVKVNAESKKAVIFNGDTLKHIPNIGRNGAHELALRLFNGNNMSYPTLVFLDEKLDMIQNVPGYKDAIRLKGTLLYMKNNLYTQDLDINSFVAGYMIGKKE